MLKISVSPSTDASKRTRSESRDSPLREPRDSSATATVPSSAVSFDEAAGPTTSELLNLLENESDEISSDDEDYQSQFGKVPSSFPPLVFRRR